jgi:conflict system pore-forming effector with SLATT domain
MNSGEFLEMHSRTEMEPISSSTLEGQLREMYGRLAYTQKTHEKMADACTARFRVVKTVEIVLSALSSGSLLIAVLGESPAGSITGAVLSTVLLGILLYFKEGANNESAQRHSEAAAKLWGLRERMLSLLVDFKEGAAIAEVRSRRDSLNAEMERVYLDSPRTSPRAYEEAQRALKTSEELFFSDSELDRILPKSLRRESVT